MRYPKPLKENGTIGFVAPSYGCNIEPYYSAFQNAQAVFRNRGYGLQIGPNCYEGTGIGISNTPEACANELNEFYVSHENDVIISCGGGELMCEILPYVDFDVIRNANPKWFMGFSDNTNFVFLSATICDTAAIYGPCAAAYGMEPWHDSLKDAWKLLTGRENVFEGYDLWEKESLKNEERPLEPYHLTEKTQLRIFNSDRVEIEGRLLGGCMDCLVTFLGTEFDFVRQFNEKYKEDGIIWFLEACDLNVMGIRRAIWQMKHAGWFQYVKGFLIGRPLCFGQELFGLDQYRAVTDLLEEYHVPIIMDADIGHLSPMMPLVCGATAKVSADEKLKIEYTWR